MTRIKPEEVEKALRAWADVTLLSLELKRAALSKRYPDLNDRAIDALLREDRAPYGDERHEG